jgi:hypothetical protein
MTGLPADFRTNHLPNTTLECRRYTSLLIEFLKSYSDTAGREIPQALWNENVNYNVQWSLSWHSKHCSKIHFSIIPSVPRSRTWHFPTEFCTLMIFSSLLRMLHALLISYTWFDDPNIPPSHFLPLRSYRCILLRFMFSYAPNLSFFLMWETKFYTHKNDVQTLLL